MSFLRPPNLFLLATHAIAIASCRGSEFTVVPLDDAPALFGSGLPDELELAQTLGWEQADRISAALGLDADEDLYSEGVEIDRLGQAHVRFQQTFHDVPVLGGEVVVHLNSDGSLRSVTDAILRGLATTTRPRYASTEAIEAAVADFGDWDLLSTEPAADLWVVRHDGDHLAWRIRLRRIDGSSATSMPVYFIDAHDGSLVWAYDDLHTDGATKGTGTACYSGPVPLDTYEKAGTYYLEDSVRHLGTYSFEHSQTQAAILADADDSWTADAQQAPVEAHYAAARVWDYYESTFGRDGLDGSGGPGAMGSVDGSGTVITSYTHYGESYANAFWDGTAMYYGDGDGRNFGPLTAVDIAGHEMTHAVTENEAGFVYSGESGALDESMSDIFGAMVERDTAGADAPSIWQVGEDAYTPGISGDALRYMNDPGLDGASQDFYDVTDTPNADPHLSSGIGNLCFYLLSQGGSHPTRGGPPLVGIGADEAAAVFYRALTTYLTASSSYASARSATRSAAADLYGADSSELSAVGLAWSMVGVEESPSSFEGLTTCTGFGHTDIGSFAEAGASAFEPAGSYYTSTSAGTHSASLLGPSDADFDLYLFEFVSGAWKNVASSTGPSSDESITYSGSVGDYLYEVYAYAGGGSYTLCSSRP
jgi:Zn-dependent metalloprotease